MKKFLGIPCPGCGGQRAVLYLLKGDFAGAFWMYPAIYPLLCFGFLLVINYFHPLKRYSKFSSILSGISVLVILINYGRELREVFFL